MTAESSASSPARCPKCGTEQHGEPACRACGLAAANMASFPTVRDAAVPAGVLAAWKEVEARWESEAAHDALWNLVAANGCYAWAAGRYRAVSLERPGDEIATRRLLAIRRATEATMLATAGIKREGGTPYRAVSGILALLVLMAIIGLVYAFIRSSQLGEDPGAVKSDNPAQVR